MKNVCIISSSPRKNGNSDQLAHEFEKGALEAGNEVHFISLREKKIHYCIACDYCRSHGGTCVQKDDMQEINEILKKADVLVLATPVYYYNVSAQMKTLIDRTYACFMDMKNVELYYLATSADPNRDSIDGAIRAFHGFEICIPYAECKGVIYGIDNPRHGDIKNHDAQ